MGMISLILAIVAILLAGFVIFQNMSQNAAIEDQNAAIEEISKNQFDFSQCEVISEGYIGNIEETTCDQVCGSQQCVLAYKKYTQSDKGSFVTSIDDGLIECDETAGVGTSEENEGEGEPINVHRFSLDCVCCDN